MVSELGGYPPGINQKPSNKITRDAHEIDLIRMTWEKIKTETLICSEDKPEVYSVKQSGFGKSGSRREFIAKSALAGTAITIGAGQITGCEGENDPSKVMNSIHTITTKYSTADFQFSPDGKIIAVYGVAEEDVNLWSLPTGKLIKTLKNTMEHKGVKGLQFTSDGKYLVVNVYTQINIWSIPDGVLIKALAGDVNPFNYYQIEQLDLHPDGKTLAYKKYPETTIKICSIPDGTLMKTIEDSGNTNVFFKFSPDGKNLISLFNSTLRIRTFPELNLVNSFEAGSGFVYFYFNHDGTIVASSDKGKIKLWTFPECNLFKTIEADPSYTFFKFSPDGKILASMGSDVSLKLWSLPDGNISYVLNQHTEKIHSICFSNDGATLASCQAAAILLWSFKDGGVGLTKTVTENVDNTEMHRYVCFSPDGSILASRSGKVISLWSLPDCSVIQAGPCICDSVCTCNTVSEGNGSDICTCNSVDVCTCNVVCTCNAVCACDVDSGGGRSYWYPN